jgi:hypothetical protein
MRAFKNRRFVSTTIVGSVASMIYYSANVIWPSQVSKLYVSDGGLLEIGWLSMTIGGGTLLGQATGGFLCRPITKQKWQLVVFASAMTAFIGAVAAADPSRRSLGVAMTLLGSFCVGYIEIVIITTAPLCLAPEDIGLATGVGGACRAGSGAVATAIYVTILNNMLAKNVPKYVAPAALDAGLPKSSLPALLTGLSSGNFTAVPSLTPSIETVARAAYKTANSESYKVVYLASIAFGLLAIAFSFLTPNLETQFSDSVARKLHGKDIQAVEGKKHGQHDTIEINKLEHGVVKHEEVAHE